MWRYLLKLHDESRLNEGPPECLFAETLIFNEGWMLRSVLQAWKTRSTSANLPFLPFPPEAKVYSEGQLRTPFKRRRKSERNGDRKGEAHTHVDGIAGKFSIADDTKSAIELDRDCDYVAVFEAKLYSPIGKGAENVDDYYDQISRTTACLIHALLWPEPRQNCKAHVVVLYPEDNLDIEPEAFAKPHLKERIAKRLAEYKEAGSATPEILAFEAGWEETLKQLGVHFQTWEEVLGGIGSERLIRFYGLCKRFNRRLQ